MLRFYTFILIALTFFGNCQSVEKPPCCIIPELVDVTYETNARQKQFAKVFANDISQKRYGDAYRKMSSDFREQVSQKKFVALFSEHQLLLAVLPTLLTFRIEKPKNKKGSPKLNFVFLFPRNKKPTSPIISFEVASHSLEKGPQESHLDYVERVEIKIAQRSYSTELPGKLVLDFHKQLNDSSEKEKFYRKSVERFRDEKRSISWFLSHEGQSLNNSTLVIKDIEYQTAFNTAIVSTKIVSDDLPEKSINFELEWQIKGDARFWKIFSIKYSK